MKMFNNLLIALLLIVNTPLWAQEENISAKWKEVFSKYTDIQQLCVRKGLDFYKLKITSMDPSVQLVEPTDSKIKPIYDTCEKFTARKLKVDQPCNIKNEDGSSAKSICSEGYLVERDGKKLRTTIERAIWYTFDGTPLTVGFFESQETRDARIKANEEAKAKVIADEEAKVAAKKLIESEKIAEAKRIEDYKNSPQYKKEAAEKQAKLNAIPYMLLFSCVDRSKGGYDLQAANGLITAYFVNPGQSRENLGAIVQSNSKSFSQWCKLNDLEKFEGAYFNETPKLVRTEDDRSYFIAKGVGGGMWGLVRFTK